MINRIAANAIEAGVSLESSYVIGYLPLYHIYGFMFVMLSLRNGSTVVMMDKFVPDRFLRVIQDYKVNASQVDGGPLLTEVALIFKRIHSRSIVFIVLHSITGTISEFGSTDCAVSG